LHDAEEPDREVDVASVAQEVLEVGQRLGLFPFFQCDVGFPVFTYVYIGGIVDGPHQGCCVITEYGV